MSYKFNGKENARKIVDLSVSALSFIANNVKKLDTTCHIAGCTIDWNNTERSWDCPCHGARYDIDGSMLNGPTVKDLEKVELKKIA